MNKINFVNNSEPALSAETLNQMQNNIEESSVAVSPTEPTTNEKVWIDNENKKIYVRNDNGVFEEFVNIEGTVIYNNSSGSNTNITFDTIIDFSRIKRIKIYYKNKANNSVAIKEVPLELGTKFVLSEMTPLSKSLSTNHTTEYTISSTGLTIGNYFEFERDYDTGSISGNLDERAKRFLICRVVAFEY